MSLVPEFELGFWNAWILMLTFMLPQLLLSLVYKGKFKRYMADPPYNKTEKKFALIMTLILFFAIAYSIFLPLKLGTTWFYIGLLICLLALVMGMIVHVTVAATPLDKPFTEGLYRYSRHPAYLTQILILLSIGIACTSWIYLLLAMIFIILMNTLVIPEERWCLEKYGDAYREYMNSTPRWIGIPKSEKRD